MEYQEILSILGDRRRFKIGQLRLDTGSGRLADVSVEDMVRAKVLKIFASFSYPVSTELVYIRAGPKDEMFLGKVRFWWVAGPSWLTLCRSLTRLGRLRLWSDLARALGARLECTLRSPTMER